MANAKIPQALNFRINLGFVTITLFDPTEQKGDATVKYLCNFNAEDHGHFAVVNHGTRFLWRFYNAIPAFAGAAVLGVDVVLHFIEVFNLLNGNTHIVAVGVRVGGNHLADVT